MSVLSTCRLLFGRAIRLPLRLVPRDWQIPIFAGPARGMKWIAGSANAGHWLGRFELQTRRVFQGEIVPGNVVYEVGAFVGNYTLQASALVGPTGRVIAFEPSPRNLALLKEHLRINAITNVTLVEAAVGERSGSTAFSVDASRPALSRPADDGTARVAMVSLDDFSQTPGAPLPDLIKIDVVGTELGVLKGATHLLKSHHPPLIMRIHSFDLNPAWTTVLRDLGYDVTPFEGKDFGVYGGVLAKMRSSTSRVPSGSLRNVPDNDRDG
jgi:FkbM family methyltransferase